MTKKMVGSIERALRYYTSTKEQRRCFIGELTTAIVDHHLKGLYVGVPLDGEPFGVDGIAIPVYRTTKKGRVSPRYIRFSEREIQRHLRLRIEKLVAAKLKAFLKSCPREWVKVKTRTNGHQAPE